ncbi:MAG: HD domain-containing protein [Bacteroidota bacterium]
MTETDYRSTCIVPFRSGDRESATQHPLRVCVIDIGTNSFHSVIVDTYPNGAFEVLDRFKESVRLGERGLLGHHLTENAIQRSIRALKRVTLLAHGRGVTEYLAYATSAVREARNGGDFIVRIRNETGINIRVIDGDREAMLIYQGVRAAMTMRAPALIVDIGGGSTEFIVATSDRVLFHTSLKIGAARMTAQYVTTDPVGASEFRRLRDHYRTVLQPVFKAARQHGVAEIIGSSGTMENLAQVCLNVAGNPGLSIYQQHFDADVFRDVTKQVMTSSRAERERMAGIDAKRINQVVSGAVLVDVLIKDLGVGQIRISPYALREGMVEDFISSNIKRLRWVAPFADVRRRTVTELGFRFRWHRRHVHHVAAITLSLFDACSALHGLGLQERELLEYAALLHDVGYHISRSSHHKHSYYLIRQADWQGFVPEEIDIIAHVARYHRGSMPKKRHTSFQRLTDETRQKILMMASFLRIAEGLERGHFQNVTLVRTRLSPRSFDIVIETKSDPQLEIWGGRRGSDLFERQFGRKVRITPHVTPDAVIDSGSSVDRSHLIA